MTHHDNPARMKASIASFDDANRFYESSRYPHKLGHNTHVFRVVDDGMRAAAIRYHKTDIVTYREDGSIKLDSGGYRTSTTKSHMNSVLPAGVGVFQKDFEWFVQVGGYGERGQTIEFFDGMVLGNPDVAHLPSAHHLPNPRNSSVFSLVGPRKVRVSREGVALFNAKWPGSTLRDSRAYWFEFERNGDLVDTDVPHTDDGPAAAALADDAKQWLADGSHPAWAMGLQYSPVDRRHRTNPSYPARAFFNDPDDIQWLRETHLKGVAGIGRRMFYSFVLEGNEDAPDRVELYAKKNPSVHDKPVAVLVSDDGQEYRHAAT